MNKNYDHHQKISLTTDRGIPLDDSLNFRTGRNACRCISLLIRISEKRLRSTKAFSHAFESSSVARIIGFVERVGTQPGRVN